MTKKSHARLVRDGKMKDARTEAASQIQGNAIYDDIREVYTNCAKTLISYNEALAVVCEPSLIPHMDDSQKQKIVLLTNSIKNDIDVFVNDLVAINAPFKDKTGGEPKVEDFLETIGVIDQFAEFVGRCKGTLDPTFASLAAEVSIIVDSLPTKKEEDLLDVNVVSDAEVKTAAQ